MPSANLTDREKQILKALIDQYIASARPVASKVIARRYGLGLSPATIRNTIKDLEDMDLVHQPHISAGRVPTARGYKLYVDYLLRPEKLAKSDIETIQKNITKDFTGIEQVLEQTSRVLGNLSRQLGIAIAPHFDSGVLTRLELIPVAERRVLVVLAMKFGLARTVLLEVETELREKALHETAAVLNERLCGLSIGEIRNTIKDRLSVPTIGDPHLIKVFIDAAAEILNFPEDMDLHLGGTRYILNQPEFKDPARVRDLFDLLEERQAVYDLVSRAGAIDGTTVAIGVGSRKKSQRAAPFDEFSLLASTYLAGKFKGVLGIIGPTRMPYARLVGIVDFAARRLSEVLSD